MVKLVFCVRRRSELSREECQRYWREIHAPLVRSHAEVLRIRRYVQTHTLDTPANAMLQAGRGGPAGFCGVAGVGGGSPGHLPDPHHMPADPAPAAARMLSATHVYHPRR